MGCWRKPSFSPAWAGLAAPGRPIAGRHRDRRRHAADDDEQQEDQQQRRQRARQVQPPGQHAHERRQQQVQHDGQHERQQDRRREIQGVEHGQHGQRAQRLAAGPGGCAISCWARSRCGSSSCAPACRVQHRPSRPCPSIAVAKAGDTASSVPVQAGWQGPARSRRPERPGWRRARTGRSPAVAADEELGEVPLDRADAEQPGLLLLQPLEQRIGPAPFTSILAMSGNVTS